MGMFCALRKGLIPVSVFNPHLADGSLVVNGGSPEALAAGLGFVAHHRRQSGCHRQVKA
jgi:hypothetical protein